LVLPLPPAAHLSLGCLSGASRVCLSLPSPIERGSSSSCTPLSGLQGSSPPHPAMPQSANARSRDSGDVGSRGEKTSSDKHSVDIRAPRVVFSRATSGVAVLCLSPLSPLSERRGSLGSRLWVQAHTARCLLLQYPRVMAASVRIAYSAPRCSRRSAARCWAQCAL
jgi:hypothetical protein